MKIIGDLIGQKPTPWQEFIQGYGKIAADYIPHLSEEGLLRRRTFELIVGRASLEEIAHRLAAEFPKRFSSWQQALSYAGLISQEFSR